MFFYLMLSLYHCHSSKIESLSVILVILFLQFENYPELFSSLQCHLCRQSLFYFWELLLVFNVILVLLPLFFLSFFSSSCCSHWKAPKLKCLQLASRPSDRKGSRALIDTEGFSRLNVERKICPSRSGERRRVSGGDLHVWGPSWGRHL